MTPTNHPPTGRQLVLVRHAKAADGVADIDRPLADRGRADATAIGRALLDLGITPDRVVVSPARRAQQTWKRAATELPHPPASETDERIYDNRARKLLAIAHETDAATGTLVLVGHNPSMHDLATSLDDGQGDRTARDRLAEGFRTGSIAVFDISDWSELTEGTATLRHLATPRG